MKKLLLGALLIFSLGVLSGCSEDESSDCGCTVTGHGFIFSLGIEF